VDWVEERLQALHFKEFSDRLTDDFGEIQRVMAYALEAVWRDNSYQKDPESSERKLQASVEAWSRKGFRLHDPSTWQRHEPVAVPDYKLVRTSDLLDVVPELVSVAHTTADQAKILLEKVLAFVQGHSELAESMVGRLLQASGIKGRSRQKQHDVRKLLVERGLLVKQFNYFQDQVTGYRPGNSYVSGLAVRFEHEVEAARVFFAAPHPPVSIVICPWTWNPPPSVRTTGSNYSWRAGVWPVPSDIESGGDSYRRSFKGRREGGRVRNRKTRCRGYATGRPRYESVPVLRLPFPGQPGVALFRLP
jgi:hypothetical protein